MYVGSSELKMIFETTFELMDSKAIEMSKDMTPQYLKWSWISVIAVFTWRKASTLLRPSRKPYCSSSSNSLFSNMFIVLVFIIGSSSLHKIRESVFGLYDPVSFVSLFFLRKNITRRWKMVLLYAFIIYRQHIFQFSQSNPLLPQFFFCKRYSGYKIIDVRILVNAKMVV